MNAKENKAQLVSEVIPQFNKQLAFEQANAQQHRRITRRPPYSRFKLGFKYLDENSSYHYSYDYFTRHDDGDNYKVLDEREGFMFLNREIEKQMKADTFLTAYIYCTLTSTDTKFKHYNFCAVKFVRHKTPIYQPLRFITLGQKEHQLKPRPARIETILDIEAARRHFAFKE